MQRTTKKKFDIIKIIINIILLVLMILSITKKDNIYYAWYWIMVTIMLISEVYYLLKWNKVGEWNVDKKDSKAIRYSFDGLTTGTLLMIGFIYLGVLGYEFLDKSIKTNTYVIVGVYALFTLSIIFDYLALYSANKDTKELAEKTFKYKK
ncbi:MAG: hypothetical protein IJ068_03570 [Bacilli bacterium]|nr:hypothetical protein [Bacilli bacterium]